MIQDRKQQIEDFISSRDYSRAARKTLDFARDFSPITCRLEMEREAILLKQKYDGMEAAGKAEEYGRLITDFLTKVEECNGDPVERSELSLREVKTVFKGENITKAYKRRRSKGFKLAIEGSIELKTGEITGVVGMNGSGKTTLLRIIAGELSTDRGTTEWLYAPPGMKNYRRVRNEIGYVPQRPGKWNYTTWEILSLAASMHGMRNGANAHEIDFQLCRLGLERCRDSQWKELTGGFLSRLEVARSLLISPKILVLDEPLAPLDLNTLQYFLQDLKDISSSLHGNFPIIISSQHLHEIEFMANRLIILDKGKCLFNGPTADLSKTGENNMFEVSCSLSMLQMSETLSPLEITNVSSAGEAFILTCPTTVSGESILNALLDGGARISYFRNISGSSKKLFIAREGAS